MARVYTKMPAHEGEFRLAQQLRAIADPLLHLWFGLSMVPRVNDIDILMWHEAAGIFVIEVKAVPIHFMKSFGWSRCEIEDRGSSKSPHLQAAEARDSLLDFLGPAIRNRTFIVATACWPRITRREWNTYWNDEKVTGPFAESMLFQDDCYAGPDVLRERLKHIWFNPPAKKGSNRHFRYNRDLLDAVKRSLTVEALPAAAPSDYERLRHIENRVAQETVSGIPIGGSSQILFRGYPGTGKTFRLLQVGMLHALAQRRVLFACFNKVLAADIARLLRLSTRLDQARHCFDVRDVFDLLVRDAQALDVTIDAESPDEWGELITAELAGRPADIDNYDLVLIDEAQDMRTWALKMLELHAHSAATICVAYGTGQELYGTPSSWLEEFSTRASLRQLRRNFRNTMPVFQLAHVFYEAALEFEKINDVIPRFKKDHRTGQLPLFERPTGEFPQFREVDDATLPWNESGSPWFADAQFGLMVSHYKDIIQEQLEDLSDRERPIDVLILVPRRNSMEREWAVTALQEAGVRYTDYTDDANRRQSARSDAVRLCTYHSARGLEGGRVTVLGFETIDRLAEATNTDLAHLGYTVLSRSLFECLLVRRSTGSQIKPMRFVSEALGALRRVQ